MPFQYVIELISVAIADKGKANSPKGSAPLENPLCNALGGQKRFFSAGEYLNIIHP